MDTRFTVQEQISSVGSKQGTYYMLRLMTPLWRSNWRRRRAIKPDNSWQEVKHPKLYSLFSSTPGLNKRKPLRGLSFLRSQYPAGGWSLHDESVNSKVFDNLEYESGWSLRIEAVNSKVFDNLEYESGWSLRAEAVFDDLEYESGWSLRIEAVNSKVFDNLEYESGWSLCAKAVNSKGFCNYGIRKTYENHPLAGRQEIHCWTRRMRSQGGPCKKKFPDKNRRRRKKATQAVRKDFRLSRQTFCQRLLSNAKGLRFFTPLWHFLLVSTYRV